MCHVTYECVMSHINESRHLQKETFQCDVPSEKEPVNVTHFLAKIPLFEKRPINESRHICKETYQCDVPCEKEPVNVTHLLAKYLFSKRDR